VVLALIAALLVGALAARRRPRGSTRKLAGLLMDMTLIGLLAARLAFVLAWWQSYLEQPLAVFYISDGGFIVWVGVLAALLFASWRVRKSKPLWQPLGAALVSGWIVWVMAGAMLSLTYTDRSLPETALTRLDGSSIQLAAVSDQPMVVNLWATWCPPCRREMPMLEAAQERHDDVTFVFLDQREDAAAVLNFLDDEGLELDHVLIDSHGKLAELSGSRALPTTLFYNADGQLIDTHVGMLTHASLTAKLEKHNLINTSKTAP